MRKHFFQSDLFEKANRLALQNIKFLLQIWLPGGQIVGDEYKVLNPKRVDHKAGSFRINMRTGKWADFATGDKGGDIVSLYAFIKSINQAKAAKEITRTIGGCNA